VSEDGRAVELPPLSVPRAPAAPPTELLCHAAVRLLVERANAIRPSFWVTPENAAAVVEVCRRLDGIPLAIELAAARLRALPIEQVAARLDDRFQLLTSGSRTAVPRQRTLRSVMEWSWELLVEPEQAVLRRLAVFAGSCTPEAAEVVCASAGVAQSDVLDLLDSLIDKSLLEADEIGGGQAPLGPRKPNTSPGDTLRSSPCSACCLPYRLARPSVRIAASVIVFPPPWWRMPEIRLRLEADRSLTGR
jgi:hypothetical protein